MVHIPMSQHRVRAEHRICYATRDKTHVDLESLPSFIREALSIDLFEKYLPNGAELHAQRVKHQENEQLLFWGHNKHKAQERENNTLTATTPIDDESEKVTITCHMIKVKKLDTAVLPAEDNTVELSTLLYCRLTNKKFRGTHYAFLMSHTMSGKKKDTNIGVSRNPIYSVMAHNNQAYINSGGNNDGDKSFFPVIFDKDTASAAPNWRLHIALGPFYTKNQAVECCHRWVKKTRGTRSKCDKAPVLARQQLVDMYSSQISIEGSFDDYLRRINAPQHYVDYCERIKDEYRTLITVNH